MGQGLNDHVRHGGDFAEVLVQRHDMPAFHRGERKSAQRRHDLAVDAAAGRSLRLRLAAHRDMLLEIALGRVGHCRAAGVFRRERQQDRLLPGLDPHAWATKTLPPVRYIRTPKQVSSQSQNTVLRSAGGRGAGQAGARSDGAIREKARRGGRPVGKARRGRAGYRRRRAGGAVLASRRSGRGASPSRRGAAVSAAGRGDSKQNYHTLAPSAQSTQFRPEAHR